MKRKTLALWLLLSMVICLTACMGEKKGEVGTTYTSNNGIEFTVNEIAFADDGKSNLIYLPYAIGLKVI